MENARMFVSADNILTLSSYNKWGDPEVGSDRVLLTGFDGGRYPFPLSVSFGVFTIYCCWVLSPWVLPVLVMTIWKSIITIFCPKISCTGMRQI